MKPVQSQEKTLHKPDTARKLIGQYLVFLFGLMIVACGICLITKAGLGTSPASAVAYVTTLKYPAFSFGTTTFVLNVLIFGLEWILLGNRFDLTQRIGQIPATLAFGLVTDFWMSVLSFIPEMDFFGSLVIFVLGCAVLGLGVVIELAPDVLKVPTDGLTNAVSVRFSLSLGMAKNLQDLTFCLLGVLLSCIFFGGLRGVGLGTILSALLVGRFIALFKKILPLHEYFEQLAEKDDELVVNSELLARIE
ncbi:YczE/YyaS/YitT family protein [Allobaculum sp. JKK-2023]|uniref:YczE/YyaS/YitT family protein n=1 Tax=Allobaculum sp. JKK-2023 TaxID=3108943 RepID=UPI002B05EB39|nr:DUF6198 family protein [Allobaculum sp. JKK-2023]